jgi:hypothetical protein
MHKQLARTGANAHACDTLLKQLRSTQAAHCRPLATYSRRMTRSLRVLVSSFALHGIHVLLCRTFDM